MDGDLDFRVLGAVEVQAGGRSLALGGPRQRALLAHLLLEPGRAHDPADLADRLWEGRPPATAEATLRSYVSRLRGALGADVLPIAASGYFAAVSRELVDLHRFDRLAREGREAFARGAHEVAVERLRTALDLWRGRPFADVPAGGVLEVEARRLDELRLLCVEDLIEAELVLGAATALVPQLRALVAEEPLRERLRRLLVLALYRSEQQAEALAAYRDAARMLADDLGLEPGPELRRLERAILRHEVEAAAPGTGVPAPPTRLVGREHDVRSVETLVAAHALVTITGVGGAGKTRLALEIARRHGGDVRVVDLAAVSDPALVVASVAAAVDPEGDRPESLLARLRSSQLLLVLDNCEHLVDACAALAAAVIQSGDGVRILATSRNRLGVPGEVEYALEPLTPAAAVELFVERAVEARRDAGSDVETAAAICRDLDGLPLAIELAAARAKMLSLPEIAARLDDRFRFLRAWHRIADPRHRTLETMMDWSYDLLAEDERRLLRRLSVFAGGFDLDAATTVCADGDEGQAIDLLARLVDASLVRAEPGDPTRYRLLETVRQYAAAKHDEPAISRAHAEYFLAFAEASNLGLPSAQSRALQRHAPVVREQHNLRAAIDWASDSDVSLAVRLVLALENFWSTHAVVEWRERYERLLPRLDSLDAQLQARAMLDYGSALDTLGEADSAEIAYRRSRALFEDAGDERNVAYLDYRLGVAASHRSDVETARRLWRGSIETFRRLDDPIGELQAAGDLGFLEIRFGDRDLGRALAGRSVAAARELGWHWWVCQHTLKQARVAVERGDHDEAETLVREGLQVAVTIEHRPFQLLGVAILARVAAARGETERALLLWASVAATEDLPGRFGTFDRQAYAAAMPASPLPAALPLPDAVELALRR